MSLRLERPAQRDARLFGDLSSYLSLIVASVVFPFDRVLSGMVAAGLGFEAICTYLGLTRDTLENSIVRLGLRTPHDSPLAKPRGKSGWSQDDVRRLIAWRAAGVHPETIAIRLGRPVGGVRSKSRRLGVPTPPRTALRRLNPDSLTDPVAGLGFPEATQPAPASPTTSAGQASPPKAPTVDAAIVALHSVTVAPAGAIKPDTTSWAQRELPFFTVVRSLERPVTDADIVASAGSDDDLSWVGRLKHPLRSEQACRAISKLHFGLQYWRVSADVLGMTLGQLRTHRTRMDLPLDPDRKKFTPTWDRELAQVNFERCGYLLVREKARTDASGTVGWFWRKKGNCDTRSLTSQRRTNDIDKHTYDYSRQSVDLWTRARLRQSLASQRTMTPHGLPFISAALVGRTSPTGLAYG